MIHFIRDNARWLAGAFLLTFFSSFGQTFFISLSAGDIRAEYGLSHGGFGTLYMAATLASAVTLPWLGRIVDRFSPVQVALIIMPMLALGALGMAFSHHLAFLVVVIYVLRLFGQGMMTQTALTATGRWFVASRGRAISLVTLGHNAGEAVFPFVFVLVAGAISWRMSWVAAALLLVAAGLPLILSLVRVDRAPRASDPVAKRAPVRDWTRGEVLRDPYFWILTFGVLAPPFIGTTVFFHQVYLVELRGWALTDFAAAFAVMSAMTISFALICGVLVDRFSALAILPIFLLPLALACFALATIESITGAYLFMGLMGVSYGFSSTLFGSVWPELYGLRHLGAIRAVVVALMVFATAMGPGVTGFLIDHGVSYPGQIMVMGIYCVAAVVVLTFASRKLVARRNLIENLPA